MKLIFAEKKNHPILSSNKQQNRLQKIQLLSTRTQRESPLKVIQYPNNIPKTYMVTKLRRKYFRNRIILRLLILFKQVCPISKENCNFKNIILLRE
jgi:hypothetical protein